MDIDEIYIGDVETLSTIHHALRSSRRRTAIILLANVMFKTGTGGIFPECCNAERSISVRTLSRQIVAIDQEVPVENATGDAYHNVYTSLIQTHLPRLDAIDAINYDSERKIIHPDKNLLGLAVMAVIFTPITTLLFDAETVDHFQEESGLMED